MRPVSFLAACGLLLAFGETGSRVVWSGPGVTLLGAPTSDGRWLSCVDPATRAAALKPVGGGAIRPLFRNQPGSNEFAYFSVPSRDGSRVAFAWFNDERYYDLRVAPAEGGTPRVLVRNSEAGFVQPTAWTPDNQWILTLFFRRDNISQIALVHSTNGEVRVLRSLNWVYPKKMDVSPDGRWIIYDSFAGERPTPRDIYLLAIDGSREIKLIEHSADDLFPLWSPRGDAVLFASDRMGTLDAWVIDVRDGQPAGPPRLLRRGLGRFLPLGFTRDGSLFFGLREGAESPGLYGKPDARIAYFSRRGAENFGLEARALMIREPNGATRELDVRLAHMEKARWSPDGLWLLISGADGKGRAGLFRVRVSDGLVQPVLFGEPSAYRGVEGAWLDNSRVAYLHDGGVRERDVESGEDKPLLPPQTGARAIAAGPDGLAVATATGVFVHGSGQRWAVKGIEQVDWFNGRLLVTKGASTALLHPRGLDLITLDGFAGGALNISENGQAIAYPRGDLKQEVRVLDHVFPPAPVAQ